MKLAIVGGSAASTPALFLTAQMQAIVTELETVLIGRSMRNLHAVERALRIAARIPQERVRSDTDYDAVRGSDVVLLQARYGGYDARARDETFPLKFGMCGDEGLGAGGLAAGWRSWPEIAKVLSAIRRLAPRARIVLMTAPLGLLVRCARRAFPDLDLVGICELPWATLQSICSRTSIPLECITFDYAGINHLGWFDSIQHGDVDVIDRFAQRCNASYETFPPQRLVRTLHAFPLKYLALHYQSDEVLKRQRAAPPRATELAAMRSRALAAFASDDVDEIIRALSIRPTPWYADAVAPYIAMLAGRPSQTVFFLSEENNGYLPQFAHDDVIEVPHEAHEGSLRRRSRTNTLSFLLEQTLRGFIEYERIAAEAIASDLRDKCACVLAKHPWAQQKEIDALSSELLGAI